MRRYHRHLSIAVLLSEFSHVFCCILPTVFTVLSFAANLGLVSVLPGFILDWHEYIHGYELPIIIGSGAMLALGWLAYLSTRKVDCHDEGCCHPPCEPQKNTNARILQIASVLFLINISIFLFVHKNILHLSAFQQPETSHAGHSGE